MATQPVSGSQYTRISGTAAGSTVISNRGCNFNSLLIGQNKTGTVTFYDSATTAGTSSTNFLQDIQNTVGTIPTDPQIGIRLKNGLVAVTGGTTDMLVCWE